ncbi:MAG: SH3 domain-containing protein [Bellilinea sp.]
MKKQSGLFGLITLLVLAACSPSTPAPVAVTQTLEASPVLPATWTPSPPPTETPQPSATPFQPFEAKALADNLNLRANPGYLFDVLQMLAKDTPFQVIAKSPGGEWIYVELADRKTGWLFAQLIATDQDLQQAPIREPEDVQLITGTVKEANGQPINGIQFMIQGAGTSAPRTDALTDANGIFYAFLPAASAGKWYVSFTAVSCASVTMDKDCNCLNGECGTVEPALINLTLPQVEPLEFLWQ